jgi:hypothetical protein
MFESLIVDLTAFSKPVPRNIMKGGGCRCHFLTGEGINSNGTKVEREVNLR